MIVGVLLERHLTYPYGTGLPSNNIYHWIVRGQFEGGGIGYPMYLYHIAIL